MSRINDAQLKQLIEAALFVADAPQSAKALRQGVLAAFQVTLGRVNEVLDELEADYAGRGINLVRVAGGYRFQSNADLSDHLSALWQERAPRYSRALLETLALIAYRQPITRGQIEKIRGVAVSSNIIRTLMERDWVKVVGHKEVPGRPALYATTDAFLHYFCLGSLSDLPPLSDEGAIEALLSGAATADPVH
ncbi:SMC-Scp complex subunit ScpB [Ferrimonas sediminicola]|uniref:SMC-Scp complex subunit ScpB n=1 Tax=Ferrimonas sediminicola TaxID=2569538 RepID=A0A4U1BFE5_9GAMM|nr:SMC-Scp complex subunit ScpB [Ferrimonas sediminicola]TKB49984.1 SMC-Scp complex subunit ScpB [Ferrimonas sediminicola]